MNSLVLFEGDKIDFRIDNTMGIGDYISLKYLNAKENGFGAFLEKKISGISEKITKSENIELKKITIKETGKKNWRRSIAYFDTKYGIMECHSGRISILKCESKMFFIRQMCKACQIPLEIVREAETDEIQSD